MADRYIEIDLGALKDAKNAIANYQMRRARLMSELVVAFAQTEKTWQAEDSEAFILRWNGMHASDGIITVTTESIKAYHSILAAAYSVYRKAQEDSVNQASQISGW